MIIKRKEKDGIVKAIYSSSNICASVYNTITNELTVIFSNGGQYKYTDVAKTDYMRFETAESQGIIMNSHIKKYTTTKLESVDTSEILKEVEQLKTQEEPKITPEIATKEMLQLMNEIVGGYIKNGKITSSTVTTLKEKIETFEKVTKKPELVNE